MINSIMHYKLFYPDWNTSWETSFTRNSEEGSYQVTNSFVQVTVCEVQVLIVNFSS